MKKEEVFRLSYRRAMKFLDEFYRFKPHWAALQKFRKRMPLSFWQKLLVRHHAKKSGEVKDVRYLVEQAMEEIELILMDKAYDSEKLHRYLRSIGIFSVAPVKKNWAKGQLRKQLKDCFDYALYWQRNLIECLFSAFKRLMDAVFRRGNRPMLPNEDYENNDYKY